MANLPPVQLDLCRYPFCQNLRHNSPADVRREDANYGAAPHMMEAIPKTTEKTARRQKASRSCVSSSREPGFGIGLIVVHFQYAKAIGRVCKHISASCDAAQTNSCDYVNYMLGSFRARRCAGGRQLQTAFEPFSIVGSKPNTLMSRLHNNVVAWKPLPAEDALALDRHSPAIVNVLERAMEAGSPP